MLVPLRPRLATASSTLTSSSSAVMFSSTRTRPCWAAALSPSACARAAAAASTCSFLRLARSFSSLGFLAFLVVSAGVFFSHRARPLSWVSSSLSLLLDSDSEGHSSLSRSSKAFLGFLALVLGAASESESESESLPESDPLPLPLLSESEESELLLESLLLDESADSSPSLSTGFSLYLARAASWFLLCFFSTSFMRFSDLELELFIFLMASLSLRATASRSSSWASRRM
mmetsp:Transcript_13685/g.20130  ORF Transcript_13685/g.20130 Transcript_13685/m.20130 type:complete len:231 (-) Transcript_13685:390-1082(-)